MIDNRKCQGEAAAATDYSIRVIEGSVFNQHRTYNRTYSDCMKGHGYGTRSWLRDVVP